MTPIINPMLFYFIGVGTHIQVILIITAVLFGVLFGGWAIADLKIYKKFLIPCIICAVIAALIPSKETCYTMMAATIITPDNLTTVTDSGKDLVDYVVDSVDKILDKETNDDRDERRR